MSDDIARKLDEIVDDGGKIDFAVRWDRRIHNDQTVEFHQRNIDMLLRAEKPSNEDAFLALLTAYTRGIDGVWVACGEAAVRALVQEAQDVDDKAEAEDNSEE